MLSSSSVELSPEQGERGFLDGADMKACLRKGQGKDGKPDGRFWKVGDPGLGSLQLQPPSKRVRFREEPLAMAVFQRSCQKGNSTSEK